MNWAVPLFVLAALMGAGPARGDEKAPPPPPTLTALDHRLADVFAKDRIPGASVVVIERGDVTLSKTYGTADRATNRPVTPDTPFRAGSISKSITSIAVMLLVEEGKLSLDTPLSSLAPEVQIDNPWDKTDPVRIAHLLEHTSGIEDLQFRHYLVDGHDMPLLRAIESYGPYRCRWKPGGYFSYSNAGPVIVGYVVEKVSGMSFAEFTRQRIFAPLGMTSARWDKPTQGTEVSRSYWADDLGESPYIDIPGKPAGALIVTADDLARLVKMLLGRGTSGGVTLLRPESVVRMETPVTSLAARAGLTIGYGLGNHGVPDAKAIFRGHNGAIDGFFAEYDYVPEHGAGAIVMINGARPDALEEAMTAARSYLERDWPVPAPPATIDLAAADLEPWGGRYVDAVMEESWEQGLDLLLPANLTVADGGLSSGDARWRPVARNLFVKGDDFAPTRVFFPADDGTRMVTNLVTKRKVPATVAFAKVGFWYGLVPLALVGSAGASLFWVVGAIRKRVRGTPAWLVRLVPALAAYTVPALILALATTMNKPDPTVLLGRETPTSVSIFLLSILVPASGVAALLVLLKYGKGASAPVRFLGWLNTIVALCGSLYFFHVGFVGLRTWML